MFVAWFKIYYYIYIWITLLHLPHILGAVVSWVRCYLPEFKIICIIIWITKLLFTDLGVWILSVDDICCDLSIVSSSYCLSKLNRQRKQQTLEW
jgi:hypothetical protein